MYRYCNNSPNNYTDPKGQWFWLPATALAGALIGAVANVGMTLVTNAITGKETTWGDLAGAAVSGAITGGVAGAMAGTGVGLLGLLAANSVAGGIGGGVGNAVTQGIDIALGDRDEFSLTEVGLCFGLGAAAGLVFTGAGRAVTSFAPVARNGLAKLAPRVTSAVNRFSSSARSIAGHVWKEDYGFIVTDPSMWGWRNFTDKIGKAAQLAINKARGSKFERAVLKAKGLIKHTAGKGGEGYAYSHEGRALPDAMNATAMTEVKNVITLSYTKQLRIMVWFARATGRTLNLVVSPRNVSISKPLEKAIGETGGKIEVFDPVTKAFTPRFGS